jgi:hypothetical protein
MNEELLKEKQTEFFSGNGVRDFLIPMLVSARGDLVEHWVSTGEESDRFRIMEIDDILGEIERLGES